METPRLPSHQNLRGRDTPKAPGLGPMNNKQERNKG